MELEADDGMNKGSISDRDVRIEFITPTPQKAGSEEMKRIREKMSLTKGSVITLSRLVCQGNGERADYTLFYKAKEA